MKYRHISQKPYCCIPAAVQMILSRRSLPTPSQADIGYDLGIVLPPEKRHTSRSHNEQKPQAGWGTRIHIKKYSLNEFFKKSELPLTETYYSAKSFKTAKSLQKFICDHLKKKDDLLVCFNYPILYGQAGSWGHASLVERVEGNQVFLRDPGRKYKELRKVRAEDLLESIQNHFKGGVWVVSST